MSVCVCVSVCYGLDFACTKVFLNTHFKSRVKKIAVWLSPMQVFSFILGTSFSDSFPCLASNLICFCIDEASTFESTICLLILVSAGPTRSFWRYAAIFHFETSIL